MSIRFRSALVATLVAAIAAMGLGSGRAAAAAWTLERSPLRTGLLGVTSGGRGATWAFGFGAERWTPAGWRVSPTPGLRGDLWAGVAVAPGRIWAVGQSPIGGNGHGLIMERAAGAWHRAAALAAVSGLRSVAHVPGTSRIWAAGWRGSGGTAIPLVERRSATGWRSETLPAGSGVLNGIAAIRGETFAVGSGPAGALALRRTPAGWARTPVPRASGTTLLAIAHVQATARFIAVGYRTGVASRHPVAYLWDGARWSSMAIAGGSIGELDGVVSIRRGDAWAVGSARATSRPVAMHWDRGPAWTRVAVPQPPGSCGVTLHAVAALPGSASALWAVGDDGCGTVEIAHHSP
jgi:hypothetical protein